MNFKSGFVTIVGRPNVGKSTLINALIGRKIAITSPKPQTTRHLITGVVNGENFQLVFVDTPGMHRGKNLLGKTINNLAVDSLKGMDIIVFVVDEIRGPGECHVINHFRNLGIPVFLVINKIDKLKGRMAIDEIILSYVNDFEYAAVIPVSAKEKTYVDKLVSFLVDVLEEGPQYYPLDMDSDQTDSVIMGEIIREKVIYHTKEEVPHSVAVVIESAKKNKALNTLDVSAIIVVERDSQKGIVIGSNGEMLKQIGTEARLDINDSLNLKVHLELFVKVKKEWRSNLNDLKRFGIS